jgi:hypothetical protein
VPESLARSIAIFLVVVHAGLGLWALVGFLELGLPETPWNRVSNPLFSRPMLLLQWTLVLLAVVTFITGYLTRWRHTPAAMAGLYGAMTLTCAYQTFFILTASSRFRAMAIEYVEYAVILAFLFSSSHMRSHFS